MDFFNLQFFAEDGAEDSGDSSNAVSTNTTNTPNAGDDDTSKDDTTNTSDQNKPYKAFNSKKELDSWFDSNFDKRASKMLENAKAKWIEEQNKQKSYEQMSAEEKREYDLKQKETELDKKLKEVTVRENRANIAAQLASDGLPTALVDTFHLSDSDTLKDQYKAITQVFRDSVDKQVQAKLANSVKPPKTTTGGKSSRGTALAAEQNKRANSGKSSLWGN